MALTAGNPVFAPAFAADEDCAMAASMSSDGGRCDGPGNLACSNACSMSSVQVAIESSACRFPPIGTNVPLVCGATLAGLNAGPPDTAPPKSPSA